MTVLALRNRMSMNTGKKESFAVRFVNYVVENSAEIVCEGLALGGSANLPDTYCMLKQK